MPCVIFCNLLIWTENREYVFVEGQLRPGLGYGIRRLWVLMPVFEKFDLEGGHRQGNRVGERCVMGKGKREALQGGLEYLHVGR